MQRPLSRLVLVAAVCLTAYLGSTNAQADEQTAPLAAKLVEQAGFQRGVCAVLGVDRDVALELVRQSEWLVHVREPDAAKVAALKALAAEAGVGIDRLVVQQGPLERLPYVGNLIDVVIATQDTDTPKDEILRVLRPNGTAIFPQASGVAEIRKPLLEGTDDWPMWEHGPDNNPASTDTAIKAPYLTQFLAAPYFITMPAITTAAGGRTFLATGHIAHHIREWDMVNKLIARNGYNGTILWTRDLPDGFLAHRSAFYATEDTFHMIDGDRLLLLDAATGVEKGEIRVPDLEGDWSWMVIDDGILYVLAGLPEPGAKVIKGDRTFGGWSWADLSVGYYSQPHVPWGFGDTLVAYDLEENKVLWKHQEEEPIDSRSMAIRDGKMYLYSPDRYIRCLDVADGTPQWANGDAEVLQTLEQPGRGLVSTPGFRSCCLAVATPDALVMQAQTRMNVLAVSTTDGSLLWTKKKFTNNPNALYVDGKLILGVGPRGSHVAIDPVSGEVLDDLGFHKVSCVRLTASADSFFVRGEGTVRHDRATGKNLIDGALRPACNDGALPANGMLYIGPWACDCNLSLVGACAKTSAGDFRFDYEATDAERLESHGAGDIAPFEIDANDWPTYRGSNDRNASSNARLARPTPNTRDMIPRRWTYTPPAGHTPTAPITAGGLVFTAGTDGQVRALDGNSGSVRWQFATEGAIKAPPTIADGRAYVGSGDGHVYALEAASGRLLWRFRAAPVERTIMVFGNLTSTWPVNTGVLVHEGTAYFAAGIIDTDGTYVYALDAASGKLKWQNNSSGHLNAELRKGVSAQGNLTIQGKHLLMAGGNQVNPARFDLATGECLAATFDHGRPKANHGRFVGTFLEEHTIHGGRILYAPPENMANKDSFVLRTANRQLPLSFGAVPPAWNDQMMALVNFRLGKLTCIDLQDAAERLAQGLPRTEGAPPNRWRSFADQFDADGAVRWATNADDPNKFEVVSLAIASNEIVAVVRSQNRIRAHAQWYLMVFLPDTGVPIWFWRQELPSAPLPDGLAVDKDGQVVVTLLDGSVLMYGPNR